MTYEEAMKIIGDHCNINTDNPIRIRDTIRYRDGMRGDIYAPGTVDHGAHIRLTADCSRTRDGRAVVMVNWDGTPR